MKLSFVESATKSLSSLDKKLTDALRKDAVRAKWPTSVVSNLTVKTTKAGIAVVYPEDIANVVGDLEYGTMGTSPKSVLRKFVNDHSGSISDNITDWSLNYLEENDIIP